MKYPFSKYDIIFLPIDENICIDHAAFSIMNEKYLFKEEVRIEK
jgi:hypothetical protein